MPYTIVIDAGHGGSDPGAVYEGRREKDDNLSLAMAVGELLSRQGVSVIYTRTTDVYQTPFEKAQMANQADADFFISFHRNSSEEPNQYTGVETLVYDNSGIKQTMAENINGALSELGFRNLGVKARPGLVVLRRTKMPALLIETGFLNNEQDNTLYDEKQEEIARAIADAVLGTLDLETVTEADRRAVETEAARENRSDRPDDIPDPTARREPPRPAAPPRPTPAGTGKSFRHTGNLLPCPDRPFPHPPECRPYALRPSRPGLSRFSSRRGRLFQGPGRRLPPARKCHSDGTPPAPRRLFHPDYHLSV